VTSYRVTVVVEANTIDGAHANLFTALSEQDVKYTSFEIEEF
jgi:hypothetical protein